MCKKRSKGAIRRTNAVKAALVRQEKERDHSYQSKEAAEKEEAGLQRSLAKATR